MSARYSRGQKKASIAPISNNFVSANVTQNVVTPVAAPQPAPQASAPQLSVPQAPVQVQVQEEVKDVSEVSTEGQEGKPKWMGIKKKLSAKEKRIRNNKKLRKLLAPKNALMAFNELLQGSSPADFKLENNGQNYVAEVVFNNIKYEGYGTSKNTAKNDACEKAVRDLVIARLSKLQSQEATKAETSGGDDVEMKDADDSAGEGEDSVPMLQLASFALHKLFAEWSAEGFEVPSTKLSAKVSTEHNEGGASGETRINQPKKTILKTELPANATDMHPTMLLSAMRAGIHYEDLGSTGQLGNTTQNCGVTVDGQHFVGSGRSKKLARKAAAIKACNQIFGTAFCEEN